MNIIEAYKQNPLGEIKNKKGDKEIKFDKNSICLSIKTPNHNIYCGYYTEYLDFYYFHDLARKLTIKAFLELLTDDWEVVE